MTSCRRQEQDDPPMMDQAPMITTSSYSPTKYVAKSLRKKTGTTNKWSSPLQQEHKSANQDEPQSWTCQQCMYQNNASDSTSCGLCGFDKNFSTHHSESPWRFVLAEQSSCLPFSKEAPKPPQAQEGGDGESDSHCDSIGTIRTSNIMMRQQQPSILAPPRLERKKSLSPNTNDADSDDSIMLFSSHQEIKPSLTSETDSTAEEGGIMGGGGGANNTSEDKGWWKRCWRKCLLLPRKAQRGGGRSCACSSRMAFLGAIFLLLMSVIMIVLAVLAKQRSSSSSSSTTTDSQPPPIVPLTPPPTPSTTTLPQGGNSTVPPHQEEETLPRKTQSPTATPIPPESLSLLLKGTSYIKGATSRTFGTMISLNRDGTMVAISAPNAKRLEDDDTNRPGSVQVYQFQESDDWVEIGNFVGLRHEDRFGLGMMLSESNVLAIGAPGGSYVTLFKYDSEDNEWFELGTIQNDEPRFGTALAMNVDGTVLAVASESYCHLYKYTDNNEWHSMGEAIGFVDYKHPRGFKVSLDASGTTLAISGPGPMPGFVQVYDYVEEKEWISRQLNVASFVADSDVVAAPSIDLSHDGNVVAIRGKMPTSQVWVLEYNVFNDDVWKLRDGKPIELQQEEFRPREWFADMDSRMVQLDDSGNYVTMNGYASPLVFYKDRPLIHDDDSMRTDSVALSGNAQTLAVGDLETGRVHVYQLI